MANLLLSDPDLILLHLPKTGGTSIQNLCGKRAAMAFGFVPKRWPAVARLAVTRNPKSRFLSAVRMFKFGDTHEAGRYSEPTLPDLTVTQALDVLEDPEIPFDRLIREPLGNLKHHILPQTHPFNCLHLATDILCFERLSAEYEAFAAHHALPAQLPHLRRTPDRPRVTMTDAEEARMRRLFAEDYRLLGYEGDGEPVRPRAPLPSPPQQIYDLWPALFSDNKSRIPGGLRALPSRKADLALFRSTPIPGTPGRTWPGRKPVLGQHFRALAPEFKGSSFLALLLASSIVVTRRARDDAVRRGALQLFFRCVEDDPAALYRQLNLRWLTSVADTFADHGKTPGARALGLLASTMANFAKLAESEVRLYRPAVPWPPKHRFSKGGPLFDGVITYWVEQGDLIDNLAKRLAKNADGDALVGPLCNEVFLRLKANDTFIARLEEMKSRPVPPLRSASRGRFGL